MRIIYANRGEAPGSHPQYEAAFARERSLSGIPMETLQFHYVGYVKKYGWKRMWDEVIRMTDEFHPDLIYFHHFNHFGDEGPADCIRQLKMRQHAPLFFGSWGDLFQQSYFHLWRRPIPRGLVEMAVCADAFFPTSMGRSADFLGRQGARNIVFMPHVYSDEHFGSPPFPHFKKEFSVVMCGGIGTDYHHPVQSIGRSITRIPAGFRISHRYGNRACIVGRGWQHLPIKTSGVVAFKDQVNLFLRSEIAIDARAPYDEEYYASDRPFFIAGCGVPLIQFYTPRFEKIFQPNLHAYYAHSASELVKVCDQVLAMDPNLRNENAEAAMQLIRTRHMADNRIDTIVSVADALLKCRDESITAEEALGRVRLWHFLPTVCLSEEKKHAIKYWKPSL